MSSPRERRIVAGELPLGLSYLKPVGDFVVYLANALDSVIEDLRRLIWLEMWLERLS